MKAVRAYLRRLNTAGHVPGLQSWALAAMLGLALGTAYQVDTLTARLPDARAFIVHLVMDGPVWAYVALGFALVALLVIVPVLRAFRCAPLEVEVWTEAELQTLHEVEAEQAKRHALAKAMRRADDRRTGT